MISSPLSSEQQKQKKSCRIFSYSKQSLIILKMFTWKPANNR